MVSAKLGSLHVLLCSDSNNPARHVIFTTNLQLKKQKCEGFN